AGRVPGSAAVAQSRIALPPRNRRPTRHRGEHGRKTTRPRAAIAALRAARRNDAQLSRRPSGAGKGKLMKSSQPIHDSIADEQAALWAARLDGDTLDDAQRAELETWLAQKPHHRALLSRYCQF